MERSNKAKEKSIGKLSLKLFKLSTFYKIKFYFPQIPFFQAIPSHQSAVIHRTPPTPKRRKQDSSKRRGGEFQLRSRLQAKRRTQLRRYDLLQHVLLIRLERFRRQIPHVINRHIDNVINRHVDKYINQHKTNV